MFDRVKKVSSEFLDNYISCWAKRKSLPSNDTLLYCKEGNKYIGVDNTTNDCWVEECVSKKEVQKWLNQVRRENFSFKYRKDRGDAR